MAFQAAVAGARQGLGADSPDGFSPRDASAADLAARIVDCIEAAQLLPAAAALDFERIAFEDCLVSEAAAGLCHLATARETAADLGVLRRRIGALPHRVAVIGAGGADLAGRLLGSGAEVVLCEPDTGALARAVQRIAARQDQAVRVRSLEPERRAALQAMLTPVADLRGMGDATFAFVFGTAGRRPSEALVRRLDRLLPPLAVMALASASGSPDALAAASGRPGAVVGFQIYGSAGVQPLAEVIPHARSTPVAGALSAALLQAAGLSTVMAGRVVAATALPSVDALDPARAPLLLSAVGDMPQAAAKPAYTLRTASPPFGTRPDGMTASGPAGQGLAAPGLSAQSSAGRGPGGDWTDALGSGARAPGSGGSGADGTGAVDPRAARLPVASPGAFSPGAFNPGAFSPGSDGLGSDGLGSDGLGNPLLDGWRIAAFSLLTDGATPAGVDAVARAAGHAFGPFRQMDEAGLDTVLARLRGRLTGESLPLIGHLCAAGWNGRRGGRGFFRYDGVTAVEDQDVNALLRDDIAARGLAAQRMSAATGLRRLHLGLIVAGARLVASGVARQSGDVDLVAQQATGAPPRWGGPLHAADRAGLAAVLTDLRKLAAAAAESGKGTRGIVDFWTPPELLVDLVKSGGRFADAPQAGRPGRGGGRRNAQPASRIGAAPPVAGPTATQRPAG